MSESCSLADAANNQRGPCEMKDIISLTHTAWNCKYPILSIQRDNTVSEGRAARFFPQLIAWGNGPSLSPFRGEQLVHCKLQLLGQAKGQSQGMALTVWRETPHFLASSSWDSPNSFRRCRITFSISGTVPLSEIEQRDKVDDGGCFQMDQGVYCHFLRPDIVDHNVQNQRP